MPYIVVIITGLEEKELESIAKKVEKELESIAKKDETRICKDLTQLRMK